MHLRVAKEKEHTEGRVKSINGRTVWVIEFPVAANTSVLPREINKISKSLEVYYS